MREVIIVKGSVHADNRAEIVQQCAGMAHQLVRQMPDSAKEVLCVGTIVRGMMQQKGLEAGDDALVLLRSVGIYIG